MFGILSMSFCGSDVGHETLYGLRGQLAKDGCADSQFVIAKDLLQDQAGEFYSVFCIVVVSQLSFSDERTFEIQGTKRKMLDKEYTG